MRDYCLFPSQCGVGADCSECYQLHIAKLEQRLAAAESRDKPFCPICKTEMSVAGYAGYYESFNYWQCNCDDDEMPAPDNVWRGGYA